MKKIIPIIFMMFCQNISGLSGLELYSFGVEFVDKGDYFEVMLPYQIREENKVVYDLDTPLAIDIIEIRADNNVLHYIDDMDSIDGRTYWITKETSEDVTIYYISMLWYKKDTGSIRWNDGKGLYFTEIEPGIFKHNTNTFELSKGMKTVDIKYKIRLPKIDYTTKGDAPINIDDCDTSDIFNVTSNIENIW